MFTMRHLISFAALFWACYVSTTLCRTEILTEPDADAADANQPVSLLQMQVFTEAARAADVAGDIAGNPFGDIASDVSNVVDSASAIADVVSGKKGSGDGAGLSKIMDLVSKAGLSIGDIMDIVGKFTSNPPLDGHPREYVNWMFLAIFASIAVACSLVYAMEKQYPEIYEKLGYRGPSQDGSPSRPALWTLTLLLASYVLLIPALCEILFSFKIGLKLLGFHVVITNQDVAGSSDWTPGPISESTISVIHLLYKTGSTLGASLIVLYAIVVPTAKIILLAIGERFRFSENVDEVRTSRRCILFVQYISKWACPDMFAYIFLLYLLRHLPAASSFIEAPSKLDVGFTCFSIFCITSTASSLAIKPPNLPEDTPRSGRFRMPGNQGTFMAATLLLVVFTGFLWLGMYTPVMALRINEEALVEPNGPLPKKLEPVIKGLNIMDYVNTEVAIWPCIQSFVGYVTKQGEGNCILAVVMLLVFAIGMTCADMIALVFAAWNLPAAEQLEYGDVTAESKTRQKSSSMKLAKVLGKLSMLDVTIMGVIVVCYAAGIYERMGVIFYMESGIYYLLAAEAAHYITYWLVSGAVEQAEAGTPRSEGTAKES